MAHGLERYDRHLVCDDHRDDSSAGHGQLAAVPIKGHWRGARIRSDRRIDLWLRSFEEGRVAIRNYRYELKSRWRLDVANSPRLWRRICLQSRLISVVPMCL